MPKTISVSFTVLVSIAGVIGTYLWTWKTSQETQTQQFITWQAVTEEQKKTVNSRLDSIEAKVDRMNDSLDMALARHVAGGP